MKAPIFAISRLRMDTDGSGITNLVTFMGCLVSSLKNFLAVLIELWTTKNQMKRSNTI